MSPFSGQSRGHSVVLSVVEPLFVSPGVASPLTDRHVCFTRCGVSVDGCL